MVPVRASLRNETLPHGAPDGLRTSPASVLQRCARAAHLGETLSFHYGKHHATYVKKLNDAVTGDPHRGLPPGGCRFKVSNAGGNLLGCY